MSASGSFDLEFRHNQMSRNKACALIVVLRTIFIRDLHIAHVHELF